MSKISKLDDYSLYDEYGNRDYMVYEIQYDDGHKEYVSRDVFRNLKTLEIIKGADFSLEFDESQNEWFLSISNEEQCVLVAKGIGIKTYDLLKSVLK